jgi:tetratricopeptide (TPR) repeat protein
MATQNPLEQAGTCPLPEAQLDRFLLHVALDYPSGAEELEILRRDRAHPAVAWHPPLVAVIDTATVLAARAIAAALLLAADDRQQADARYNLGNAHYGQGHYRIAVEAYKAVLQLRPADANARTNLGWATQRLSHQRAGTPMKSDLRSRRGMLADGLRSPDGDPGWWREDLKSDAAGVQVEREPQRAAGARRQDASNERRQAAVNARLAASGLKKLDRLEDRPAAMLKNLMKQDAPHDGTERPPW